MAVKKKAIPMVMDKDDAPTKERILVAATELFALKGFDGTSVRDIAKQADVNVAAINYHFESKENLRTALLEQMVEEFKGKIKSIPEAKNTAEYAVKLFEVMAFDSAQCVNRFKVILEAEHHPCEKEPYPIGFEQFSYYLNKELKTTVPEGERLWLIHIVFSYVLHISVMSSTQSGKQMIDKFFPKKRASIPVYIEQLVSSLIRDLNRRY